MPSKNLCHNLSVCSGFVNFATSKSGGSCRRRQGEMVEWSITPVLKTGIRRRIGGSNPSLSAKAVRQSDFLMIVPRLFLGGCLIILKFLLFLFRKYRLPDVFYCNYYFRFVVAVG